MILPAIEVQTEIQPAAQVPAKQGASAATGELASFGALSFGAKLREATQLQGTGADLTMLTEEGDSSVAGAGSSEQGRSATGDVQTGGTASGAKSTQSKLVSGEIAGTLGRQSNAASGQFATLTENNALFPVGPGSLASGGRSGNLKTHSGDQAGETIAVAEDLKENGSRISKEQTGEGLTETVVAAAAPGPVRGAVPVVDKPNVAAKITQRVAASVTATVAPVTSKSASAKAVGAFTSNASVESASTARAVAPNVVSGLEHASGQGLAARPLESIADEASGAIALSAAQLGTALQDPSTSRISVPASGSETANTGTVKDAAVRIGTREVLVASAEQAAGSPATETTDPTNLKIDARRDSRSAASTRTADAKDGSSTAANTVPPATGSTVLFASSPSSGLVGAVQVAVTVPAVPEATNSNQIARVTQATISQTGVSAGSKGATTDRAVGTVAVSVEAAKGTALAGLGGTAETDATEAAASRSVTASAGSATRNDRAVGATGIQRSVAGAATAGGNAGTHSAGANTVTARAQQAAALAHSVADAGEIKPKANLSGNQTIERGREAALDGVSTATRPTAATKDNASSANSGSGATSQSIAALEARPAPSSGANASSAGRSVAVNESLVAPSAAATGNAVQGNAAEGTGASGSSSASGPVLSSGNPKDPTATPLPVANIGGGAATVAAIVPPHGAGALAVRETGAALPGVAVGGANAGPGVPATGASLGTATAGISSLSHGDGTSFAEPHRTLLATPTALEVGVPNGTQGWVKIRAEVGGEGQVNASLAAGSNVSQEMLHRQLPALNAYLHSEQISVTTTVSERGFGSGAGSGGGAAPFQASGGSPNAGGSPAGSSNSAMSNGQQSDAREEFRADSVGGLASGYDGKVGLNSGIPTATDTVRDPGVDAALNGTSGISSLGTRSGLPIESGQWLNVRA